MQQLDNLFRDPRPLVLTRLALPAALTIVVLAPHPDDFDAVGVSMRFLHDHGHTIHLAVLTSGASGVEDGFDSAHTAADKAAIREAEQRASCHFFGLPPQRISFLRLWENDDDGADRERLRAYLSSQRPDLVFLPHGNDTNHTHRRTYESVRAIAEQDRMKLWACLNRDAKTLSIRTDLYTDFGEEEATWKACLLRFHRSQHERNLHTRKHGFDERVLRLNREIATSVHGSSLPYAEAFELQRFG